MNLNDKPHSLLEIGAGDGSFLQAIRKNYPQFHLTAVDKNQNTLHQRVMNSDENYRDLAELVEMNKCYDFICLFHVLEHVLSPSDFLAKICRLLSVNSFLIIEAPSFSDPLLSLYNNQEYEGFKISAFEDISNFDTTIYLYDIGKIFTHYKYENMSYGWEISATLLMSEIDGVTSIKGKQTKNFKDNKGFIYNIKGQKFIRGMNRINDNYHMIIKKPKPR